MTKIMFQDSVTEGGEIKELNALTQPLRARKSEARVPPDLAQTITALCLKMEQRLAIAKGRILGFGFTDDLFKTVQQQTAESYEPRLAIVSEYKELITFWDSETEADRDVRLAAIQKHFLEYIERHNKIESFFQQAQAARAERDRVRELKQKAINNKMRSRSIKIMLAMLGMVAGIVALAFSLPRMYRTFIPRGR
jgi:hypothetical protein